MKVGTSIHHLQRRKASDFSDCVTKAWGGHLGFRIKCFDIECYHQVNSISWFFLAFSSLFLFFSLLGNSTLIKPSWIQSRRLQLSGENLHCNCSHAKSALFWRFSRIMTCNINGPFFVIGVSVKWEPNSSIKGAICWKSWFLSLSPNSLHWDPYKQEL